jgi:hypothetical protein
VGPLTPHEILAGSLRGTPRSADPADPAPARIEGAGSTCGVLDPACAEGMDDFLSLKRATVEWRIGEARSRCGDPPVDLRRRRAELAERIAAFGARNG